MQLAQIIIFLSVPNWNRLDPRHRTPSDRVGPFHGKPPSPRYNPKKTFLKKEAVRMQDLSAVRMPPGLDVQSGGRQMLPDGLRGLPVHGGGGGGALQVDAPVLQGSDAAG